MGVNGWSVKGVGCATWMTEDMREWELLASHNWIGVGCYIKRNAWRSFDLGGELLVEKLNAASSTYVSNCSTWRY